MDKQKLHVEEGKLEEGAKANRRSIEKVKTLVQGHENQIEFLINENEKYSEAQRKMEEKIANLEIALKNEDLHKNNAAIEKSTNELPPLEESSLKTVTSIEALREEKIIAGNQCAEQERVIQEIKTEMANVVSDLKSKLNIAESSSLELKKRLEKQISELRNALKSSEEEAALMKQQVPQLKEAHDRLFHDYSKLADDHDALQTRCNSIVESQKNVKSEYEAKLDKLKGQMKDKCTEAIRLKEIHCEEKVKKLDKTISQYEKDNIQLRSQLRDTRDKLLSAKEEIEVLKKASRKNAAKMKRRSNSLENISFPSPIYMNRNAAVSGAVSRRASTRTVATRTGKVFPLKDEAEEMFNNECLADLKAGRCQVPTDRNSTLRYRNSLCPPHLRSSYAAETQFLPTDGFQKDDIKNCGTKPLPRSALKELNDGSKKPGTPSRLFSHVFTSTPKDEY